MENGETRPGSWSVRPNPLGFPRVTSRLGPSRPSLFPDPRPTDRTRVPHRSESGYRKRRRLTTWSRLSGHQGPGSVISSSSDLSDRLGIPSLRTLVGRTPGFCFTRVVGTQGESNRSTSGRPPLSGTWGSSLLRGSPPFLTVSNGPSGRRRDVVCVGP